MANLEERMVLLENRINSLEQNIRDVIKLIMDATTGEEGPVKAIAKTSAENSQIVELLLHMLLKYDPKARGFYAEELRKILLNSPVPLSPLQRSALQNFRDQMLSQDDTALQQILNKPSIRPVPD